MKKSIKYIVVLLFAISIISCESWLDVNSKTSIKEEDLFKTEEGYFDALIGAYSLMTSKNLYGDNLSMSFLEVLAYSYKIDDKSGELLYRASMFQYNNTNVNPLFTNIWSRMYEAIANANNLLKRLESADQSIFDANNYNLIKGEALAVRAYMHFDLLRMFGPSFSMTDAKCMPYVTTFSKDNTPYSTAEEVVNYALRDLEEAATLLQNDPITIKGFTTNNIYLTNRNTRMNYLATKALMARIKLYKGDKEGALEIADDLIDNQTFVTLITSPTQYNVNRTIPPEHLFGLYVDNLPTTSTSNYTPNVFNTRRLYNDNSRIDAIYDIPTNNRDIRYSHNFIKGIDGIYTYIKFEQNTGDARTGYCRMPMIKMSEIYLISAECTTDLTKATKRLVDLRRARALSTNQTFADLNAVKEYIKKEYRKEFYAEGQLFYYYKRTNAQTIPDCPINISGKEGAVYVFPRPANEIEFAGK